MGWGTYYNLINKDGANTFIHPTVINHHLQSIHFRNITGSDQYISPFSAYNELHVSGFTLKIDNSDPIEFHLNSTYYSCDTPIDINLFETHHFEFSTLGNPWFSFDWVGNKENVVSSKIENFYHIPNIFLINRTNHNYTEVETFKNGIPNAFWVNGNPSYITLTKDT